MSCGWEKKLFFSRRDNRYSKAIYSTMHLDTVSICITAPLDAFYIAEFFEQFLQY